MRFMAEDLAMGVYIFQALRFRPMGVIPSMLITHLRLHALSEGQTDIAGEP